jgi:hypothetical protein
VGADCGGCGTALFQLEGDIFEEYVKKCVSFHTFRLERRLQMQKSGVHGKKHHRKKAGRSCKGAVTAGPETITRNGPGANKEINDDCSI